MMTNPQGMLALHEQSYGHSVTWVELADGKILLSGGGEFRVSKDGGLTWSEPFHGKDEKGSPVAAEALVRLSGKAVGMSRDSLVAMFAACRRLMAPGGCTIVALAGLPPGETFVQLVGTPRPSPARAREFVAVDLASVRLNGSVAPATELRGQAGAAASFADGNGDGILELILRFDRSEVESSVTGKSSPDFVCACGYSRTTTSVVPSLDSVFTVYAGLVFSVCDVLTVTAACDRRVASPPWWTW